MIAQKVDLIFIDTGDSDSPEPQAMAAAKKAGVPTFLLGGAEDSPSVTAGKDYVASIGTDVKDAGKQAGEWLIKTIKGKGKIIEIEGTSDNRRDMIGNSFKESIASDQNLALTVINLNHTSSPEVQSTLDALLRNNPDVRAIFAHDFTFAMAAIMALKSAGMVPGNDVSVVSIGGGVPALKAIANGSLAATVERNARIGPIAIDALKAYANTGTARPMYNISVLYDRANILENEPICCGELDKSCCPTK